MRFNVVLPGGGRNYAYLAGVLQGLLDQGHGITGIAGTSAGGLVALFYALGTGKLLDAVLAANRVRHSGPWNWWWPSYPFGRYDGDSLHKFLEDTLKPTLGDARIPCAVVIANLSRRRQEVVSSWASPSESSALAGRATSAVPFLFEPVMWPGRGVCVDGGLTSNAAGDDIRFPNRERVLNIIMTDDGERRDPDSVASFAGAVVSTVLAENVREDATGWTLRLPTPPGDSLDLEMSDREAQALFVQGYIRGRRPLPT